LIAGGAFLYALYLVLLPLLAASPLVWALPVLAGMGGAAILSLPIAYLQDQMADRPGTGSALMAVQKVTSDTLCAGVFAFGTVVSGLGAVAVLGALITTLGAALLLAADRAEGFRRPARLR
jgi:hypothetical protein